jgi:hypothetical protein
VLANDSFVELPISGTVSIQASAAARNDEKDETNHGSHCTAVGPLDMPSHKTAGQNVYSLQDPDNSHRKQQNARDSQCYTHL